MFVILQEPEQASPTYTHFNMDLCALMESMSLNQKQGEAPRIGSANGTVANSDDLTMEDVSYQSDGGSDCSESSSNIDHGKTYYGCAYLQSIQSQLDNYATTGGEYVEAIFTHREIFAAHPFAHRDCARAFTEIAYWLEKRAWRADRDADTEAVSTFRHEAWVVANAI